MDFLGHENVVEVAIFAPIAAYPHIRELAGLSVRGKHEPVRATGNRLHEYACSDYGSQQGTWFVCCHGWA